MAPGEVIGGATARRRRIERRKMLRTQRVDAATDTPEHSWIRWSDRSYIDSLSGSTERRDNLGGSAERRGSNAAQAKAEFEYHRDTFIIPGF